MPFFASPGGGGAFAPPCQAAGEFVEPLGPVMTPLGAGGVPGAICMLPDAAGGDPGGGEDVESSALASTGAKTSAESRLRAAIFFLMEAPYEGVNDAVETRL